MWGAGKKSLMLYRAWRFIRPARFVLSAGFFGDEGIVGSDRIVASRFMGFNRFPLISKDFFVIAEMLVLCRVRNWIAHYLTYYLTWGCSTWLWICINKKSTKKYQKFNFKKSSQAFNVTIVCDASHASTPSESRKFYSDSNGTFSHPP